jgi:hypothetical protein
METVIPILSFSDALKSRQVKGVRTLASQTFNKMVWTQLHEVPAMSHDPVGLLREPLSVVHVTVDKAYVTFGSESHGVKVHLLREGDQFVVDDLLMMTGLSDSQRVSLKQYLRSQYVYGNSVNGRASLDDRAGADDEPRLLPSGPAAPLPSHMTDSNGFER